MKIIGVDIDGVLANFNEGYREKLFEVTGRELITPGFAPPCWAYAQEFGYTKEEENLTWESIKQSDVFWSDLDVLPGATDLLQILFMADLQAEIYYMTTRPGDSVKRQTQEWLVEYGHEEAPTVLITRYGKGGAAKSLGLTHFIDDRPENCMDVKMAVPTCQCYLLTAKYNEWAHEMCGKADVYVVPDFAKFEEAIGED